MEFDSQSQYSDEVGELSVSEGDFYPGEFSYTDDGESVEAKVVYLLMPKNVPISRAARLQWLLDHLNTTITIPSHKLNEYSNDLQIISAIPREQNLSKCNHYLVTWRTEVKFIAQNYRFVYCLDMSPSHANVDIQRGEVLFNEILNCFKCSLHGLSKQFIINGNSFVFQPCIFLTIMVNTPFFISPAQQVILKGIQMTANNLNEIIKCVENHFYLLESKIADVAATALDQIEYQKACYESADDIMEPEKTVPVVTPDANFVNMLRYSMLAISLLPETSLSHILVITDGIVAMPDSNIMESLLFQLHYDAIAVSFLKVGSSFHPHAPAGFVSYTDLLYFFAHSTLGTCLESSVHVEDDPKMSMNIYHEIFLLWSFHSGNKYANMKICDNSSWTVLNELFYSHRLPTLLSKRQTDENTTASILLLLARRMREGFTVDNIYYMNGNLEIKLILQWKSSIYIHYRVSSEWPIPKNQTHFEVYVSAPYEFLHDMTCWIKKETKSLYRQAIIDRFWIRLSQLSSGDLGLAHQLSSFQFNKDWYMLPESVKNGLSVFNNLNNGTCTDNTKLILTPRDVSCLKFVNIWQPIAQIETNNWRKWFHTHKISLILKHDDSNENPVPKHLHIASSSQRYQVVQCRQAVKALYGMLANWSSFILIDNHTYLKLIYIEGNKTPLWFCIVRVSLKYLCAVLNVGFSTHTPGYLRQVICNELKVELSNLSYLSSPVKSRDNLCCVVMHKPLEKFLIRYERIPSNYTTVIFPDGTQPPNTTLNLPSPFTGSLFTTLSRYLFHKRWIWSATHYSSLKLPDNAISRILNTLTRMRMREGYSFAHSSSGIITMVLELTMDPPATCVVQYVLFPPHFARFNDDNYSGSEEDTDQPYDEAEMQMVTEVWIEPQYGKVVPKNSRIAYMDDKYYYEIADMISKIDMQCINVLLTMEHLSLMCQDKHSIDSVNNHSIVNSSRKAFSHKARRSSECQNVPDSRSPWYPILTPRIEHIPFKFDPINILPLCTQNELLFSMFIQPKEKSFVTESRADKANKLLMDNIIEHLGLLHDHELELNIEDSQRFTQHILFRHKNTYPHTCPISTSSLKASDTVNSNSQWRCFVKGVSVTHVILTFIPATLEDLKFLVFSNATNIPSSNESTDSVDRSSSRGSNFSDVPMNTSNAIYLPVYVFDCPLAMLVKSYVNYFQEVPNYTDDVYEDHRFTGFLREETTKLKSDEDSKQGDTKDDPKMPDKSSVIQHCKSLVLTHLKCFTLSLFVALHMGLYVHSSDVQAAMDQCDEEPYEVDITDYIMNICAHVKQFKEDKIITQHLHQPCPCSELKKLHILIKKKFFRIISASFNPIPTNSEFYFYKNLTNYKSEEEMHDSDDETSVTQSDLVEFRSEKDFSIYSEGSHLLQRFESGVSNISDFLKISEVTPLFLHLMCTLKYNNSPLTNTSMRVLPTCLGELIENLEQSVESLDKSKLQITLDILCLTLPPGVQNIITDYSNQGLRTTSFCSDVFQPSVGSFSEASFVSDFLEPQQNLPDFQMKSIMSLTEEIRWLLKDEMCTSFLDTDPVEESTLQFVMQHVLNGNPERSSCLLEKINLNFVYASAQSHLRFLEEFTKMQLPTSFKMCKESEFYYLAKDTIRISNGTTEKEDTNPSTSTLEADNLSEVNLSNAPTNNNTDYTLAIYDIFSDRTGVEVGNDDEFKETDSQQSEISSTNGSALATDGGYDEDVSEDEEDYYWLTNLDHKRPHLPNFWLIMKINHDMVTVYFHCRFLDLPTNYIDIYLDVQRAVCEAIRELCKKVNQLLLLQSLYETKICDTLLEPDDNWHAKKSSVSRNTSYTRLKSLDAEVSDDSDVMAYSSLSEASLNFKPGYFSCPVVWETHFILHPRLKTGPGKSGISRGILALKNILDKFSVSNRNNMFVYRDNEANVFYLRLHEDVHNNRNMQMKPNDFDSTTVSRSPSITSLPLGQSKVNNLAQSEQSIVSVISNDIIRPRVRSFGEKETTDNPVEDTLILRVHGITDAGLDVQCDLVQVLQNRLDDAVLEFLSIMLARNAMCPLTPEDVHFIQRPFKQPEFIICLSIQDFALQWLHAFTHYLKQNLLQFLNMPKYTDSKIHSHFKDYSENDGCKVAGDDHLFIYNQSQSPSSGNRGIACIALVIISNDEKIPKIDIDERFMEVFKNKAYEESVASELLDDIENRPDFYLEFRIWKQGRVNIENLTKKLRTAVSQANWDIVTEYFLLRKQLYVDNYEDDVFTSRGVVEIDKIDIDLSKEIEFNCISDINIDKNVKESVSNASKKKIDAHLFPRKHSRIQPSAKATRAITFDSDDGVLSEVYSKFLPSWFDFGYKHLSSPAINPQKINLTNRHLPHIVVKELVAMLTDDTPKSFRAIPTHSLAKHSDDIYVPYVSSSLIQKYVIISRNSQYNSDTSVYLNDIATMSSLKHTQKFVPGFYSGVHVPRQKMFWLSVENDCILIYSYNWGKDSIDKLVTNCSNLGQWLCVRSCFLNSVISQKLGLFHNQPLTRKVFMISTNNYSNLIGNLECMSTFPKDHYHKKLNHPAFNLLAILEAFRDSFRNTRYTSNDPVVIFTIEMEEMKSLEKKFREEMKKLHSMYQSRTSTTTVPQINLLMQNSRILHFCHTPLLFVPRWRLKAAATRDHSLYPLQTNLNIYLGDRPEEWHTILLYDFFTEYRNYLQTLAFMPLTIDSPHAGRGPWEKDKSSYNSVFYIQKTILGGILIFTVEFSEPFFVTKLHAIECNRLQIINSRTSVNQFTLSFLDECDRVKIMMHLHSFTYDFHLRSIYNYVSGTHILNKLCDKYNVHQFLDDFLKYYTKAPNFARNLVHTDTITIPNLVTEGRQLFDYLLSNVSQYNFKVIEMDTYDGEKEFILIRVTSTSPISYKDSQDRHHTDDFDITLIIYNLCTPYSPSDNVLHLKYYLILTSREQHPKKEIEQKLGKFRMVSQGSKTRRVSRELEVSLTKSEQSQKLEIQNSDEYGSSSSFSKSGEHSNITSHSTSMLHIELNVESVNYLGYYSSHEQLMQQIILDKAHTTQKSIQDMVAKGMIHCRTNLLWNRLITPQDSNTLTYEEFIELKDLAKLKHLCHLHPDIGSLLNQPLCWYQGLAKQLLTKYAEQNRTFLSPDGNVQYYVILHPRYFGAFMMLSIDLHTSRGELYAVYREPHKQEDEELCLAYQKSLLDGFVNCICFYLWSGMISS